MKSNMRKSFFFAFFFFPWYFLGTKHNLNLFIFLLFKKVISDFHMETMNFANNCEDSMLFLFFIFLLFFIPNNSWMAKYMICFTSFFFFFFFILGMFGLQLLLTFDEWKMFRIETWIWFKRTLIWFALHYKIQL